MKLSKYNVIVEDENNKSILYNTLSRKYVLFNTLEKEYVNGLLNDINKDRFDIKEADILTKLFKNKMVIKDDINELDEIKFLENKSTFQDETFSLVIQPTLDCNFRCVYCYEEHKNVKLDDCTTEKIIKFVETICKRIRKLRVAWFGGEPMMEFNKIVYLTNKFKDICEKNGCIYEANMTTNGYLFSEENIEKLKDISIKRIQITLDGTKEFHDKKRPLHNNGGTFDKVINNFIKLLEKDIYLTLRINVDENNYEYVSDLFNIIPEDRRKKVTLNMCNIFQNKSRISLYELYKKAIDKGYRFYDTINNYTKCEASSKNSFTIQPDGKVVFCSVSAENGYDFGELNDLGNINMKNKSFYYKFVNTSVFENKSCILCNQLPMCMGGCKYAMFKNNKSCNGKGPGNLSLEEKAKLHYYSDLKLNNIEECIII